jgi:hypothetical protein
MGDIMCPTTALVLINGVTAWQISQGIALISRIGIVRRQLYVIASQGEMADAI